MTSSRSSSPSLPALSLRPSFLLKVLTILGVLITIISYSYWGRLTSLPANFIHREPLPSEDFQFDTPTGQNWTHRIWQTSRNAVANLDDEELEHVRTWSDLNPEYRHEVLTDDMMDDYVKEKFHFSHPDIEETYFDVKDYIVRSDLIRYLLLLADGGVYNDLDVGCEKPISSWVPSQYKDSAGMLLGVEVDNKFGPDGRHFGEGGEDLFQLVNWTIMSKPNQPFMWLLVMRVLDNIRTLAKSRKQPISRLTYSIQDVLDVTGPAALTKVFFDYASNITDSDVTYHNFTKITRPRLIGEVVILPIQAFGAGHQVQWAGFEPDGSELIHHYFAGSWKTDHPDKVPEPVLTDEEKDKDEQATEKGDEKEKPPSKITQEKEDEVVGEDRKGEHDETKSVNDDGTNRSSPDKKTSTTKVMKVESSQTTETQDGQASSKTSTPADNKVAQDKAAGKDQGKQSGDDTPASVQYVEDTTANKNLTTGQAAEEEKAKAEKEAKEKAASEKAAKEKEEAEKQKAKEVAEAKEKAQKEKEAAQKKLAEEEAQAEAEQRAKAEAEKKEKESQMTQEEKEEEERRQKEEKETEERKQKWEEVKAAAPLVAQPKSDEEKQKASNDLADYDYQPD